jgi:hypothetical protein
MLFLQLYGCTAFKEVYVGAMQQEKEQRRVELTGIERLNLRVSNMINHPIAMTPNDDGSITLRWEPAPEDDRVPDIVDVFESEEPAPF